MKCWIDRYSVGCNEDIVPDCCDEPRLLLWRNTPNSPEIRVSIIVGHKFWVETEIKQSWKQTAEVTFPYLYLWGNQKQESFPDHFWMFSLNTPFGWSRTWIDRLLPFSECILWSALVRHYHPSWALTLQWNFHVTSHLYTSPHVVPTISQAAGSCLKSECVSSTDTLFL